LQSPELTTGLLPRRLRKGTKVLEGTARPAEGLVGHGQYISICIGVKERPERFLLGDCDVESDDRM
jgi:hypothetical protein